MPNLQCSTSKYGNLIVVAVTGDIDLATAETMWDEICAQLLPASALALDCTGITFIDSRGLRVLLRTHRRAAEQHASFGLIGANAHLTRVLELAGLTDLIQQFPDAESARRRLSPNPD